MDLKEIKAIIDLMKRNSLSEFELERPEFKLRLKRGEPGGEMVGGVGDPSATARYYPMPPPAMPPTAIGAPAALAPSAAPVASNDAEIKSPMIGTFYRSPSPEAGSYVEIGSEVTPETVVCIIEAMKVMNEIKAETRGVITQALVDNAKPVEFGQPLFKIRPL